MPPKDPATSFIQKIIIKSSFGHINSPSKVKNVSIVVLVVLLFILTLIITKSFHTQDSYFDSEAYKEHVKTAH